MTNCVDCEEVITNPLCSCCVSESIGQWVVSKKLSDIKLSHNCTGTGGEICIKCRKEFQLCTYCYSEDVFNQIEEDSPDLVAEFVEFFSFDLDKKGYARRHLCG